MFGLSSCVWTTSAEAAEKAREPNDDPRTQPLGRLERRDRAAARLEVAGEDAARRQRDDVEGETRVVGVAGHLDEQLLLPAHVEAERDVDDVPHTGHATSPAGASVLGALFRSSRTSVRRSATTVFRPTSNTTPA